MAAVARKRLTHKEIKVFVKKSSERSHG
ncbi:RepB family protein [Escherichia coli]